MPNPYIQLYENMKETSPDYLQNAIETLTQLKESREEWGYKGKRLKYAWRGELVGLKLFYNVETTAQNVEGITWILSDLVSLKSVDDEAEKKGHIVKILEERKFGLSLSGQTRELVDHIIQDIKQLDFSTRPSSLITPGPADEMPYVPDQRWRTQLAPLLSRKNLSPHLFAEKEESVKLEADISAHVKWAFHHIYSVPYPSKGHALPIEDHGKVARYHHGIQHISRAALYIPVFANLYRKHGDKEAMKLTDDDIKLLQIAAVFHDAAREDEDVDQWDHESAIFLYCYLTKVLNVDRSKAKLIAEAIANKDPNPKGYFVIEETTLDWKWEKSRSKKNIYQKLIHDADCLDIIRARDSFDGQHLDFYKQFGIKEPLALEEMAHLITEARSLIEIQGDSRNRTKTEIKEKYEHEDAYQATLSVVGKNTHRIISTLGSKLLSPDTLKTMPLVDTVPYDPQKGLTEENMRAAIREGKVFARGIATPSAISKKPRTADEWSAYETLAALEFRKATRRKGIATTSSHPDSRAEKEGNPLRSVCMMGYGSSVFTNAGLLILNPDVNDVMKVSSVDFGSGRGKKKYTRDTTEIISKDKKGKQINELHERLKLGGSAVKFSGLEHVSTHVEILYHIKRYSAIYYSSDPNLYNEDAYHSPEVAHPYSAILQAIFLRKEYQRAEKVELPMFEYSGLHNTVKCTPPETLTNDNIKKMWVTMCSDYIKQCLADSYNGEIYTMSADDIKVLSMYKVMDNQYAKKNAPADSNYDTEFKEEISQAIEMERQKLIKEHEQAILEKIREKASIFSDEIFFNLVRNPLLAQKVIEQIKGEFAEFAIDVKHGKSGIISVKDFFDHSNYSSPEGMKKNLMKTKVMKMYLLAQQVKLDNDIKTVQAAMATIAIEVIKEVSARLALGGDILDSLGDDEKELINLTHFSKLFGIYPDDNELKNQFDELVGHYFDTITKEFRQIEEPLGVDSPQKIGMYFSILSHLHSLHILNPQQVNIAIGALDKIDKKLSDPNSDYDALLQYLSVSKNFNVSPNIQKSNILIWLSSHRDFWITDDQIFFLCEIKGSIPLDDPDLFKAITDHIAPNRNPTILGGLEVGMGDWVDVTMKLEKVMPSKVFTEQQLAILAGKSGELFSQLLENLSFKLSSKKSSPQEACEELVDNIYLFLESGISIKLPLSAISKLNELLGQPSEKLEKEKEKILKYIYEKISPDPHYPDSVRAELRKKLTNLLPDVKQNISISKK